MSTVAVLTGPERRRRWTSAEKRRIVEESFAAGASVADVARRHDVHPNLLHGWRRQARADAPGPEPAGQAAQDGVASFATVTVVPEAGPASPVALSASGVIEIEFAAGTRLRITGLVAPAMVSAVIAAVLGLRRR
jgi:transposase